MIIIVLAHSKEMNTEQKNLQTGTGTKPSLPLHDFWELHSSQKLVIFPNLTNGSFQFTFMLVNQLLSFLLLLAASLLSSKLQTEKKTYVWAQNTLTSPTFSCFKGVSLWILAQHFNSCIWFCICKNKELPNGHIGKHSPDLLTAHHHHAKVKHTTFTLQSPYGPGILKRLKKLQ